MQLHFSGLCVLLTLLRVNPALWKFIRLTFTSYTDVDECKDDRHDCHVNGTCTNTAGSFECVCNDGYFGDGRNCSGSHRDPEIIKGPISQKIFSALRTSVWFKKKGGGRRGLPRTLPLDQLLSSDPNFHWPNYWHWSITSFSELNRKGADRRFAFHLHIHANEAWTAEQDNIKE